MRELVFALEFRGRAWTVPGSDSKRQARSIAPSQTLSTILGHDGVHARVDAANGASAVLESRVERFGDGTFVEDGRITYGAGAAVSFETIGGNGSGPRRYRAGWWGACSGALRPVTAPSRAPEA